MSVYFLFFLSFSSTLLAIFYQFPIYLTFFFSDHIFQYDVDK